MIESRRYGQGNIKPNNFMSPPTEGLWLPIDVLVLEQEKEINVQAGKIVRERKLSTRQNPCEPTLRVGSELEIILFSNKVDPYTGYKIHKSRNYNYGDEHLDSMKRFRKAMAKPEDEGGLGSTITGEGVYVGSLTTEIRTPPSTTEVYLQQINRIKRWVQENAGKYDIDPTIMSQHFHMSLVDQYSGDNLLTDDQLREVVMKGLFDIYHRGLPFLRLPELIEGELVYDMNGREKKGVREKGLDSPQNPLRLEGRMNNSDYAADPSLNLLFNLVGFRRGLEHYDKHQLIDQDNPLGDTDIPSVAGFRFGHGITTYQQTLDEFFLDEVIAATFPKSILDVLYKTGSMYPAISQGYLSLIEAREKVNKSLIGLTEPTVIFKL